MIAPRLPDKKFFDLPDDLAACLILVRYARLGGSRDYFVVQNTEELIALVENLPPQACVSIVECDKVAGDVSASYWNDHVYTADKDGNCKPSSY